MIDVRIAWLAQYCESLWYDLSNGDEPSTGAPISLVQKQGATRGMFPTHLYFTYPQQESRQPAPLTSPLKIESCSLPGTHKSFRIDR